MSILQYNGGAIIAMTGKNCVAICSDTRLGLQQQTVSCDFQKVRPESLWGILLRPRSHHFSVRQVFKMHDRLYMGVTGLATDVMVSPMPLRAPAISPFCHVGPVL